jgi:porin
MKTLQASTALAMFIALSPSAHAQIADFDASKHIGGDWGGGRQRLADDGIQFKLGHFSQTAHNTAGGERSRTAYADQFFLGGYLDLDKLWGWPGAEFRVEVTNRNGELINDEAGIPRLLQSQQIYGRGTVTRLTQFSLTQRLFDDRLRIKAGRIYPNADFFAQSCAFQHLSFCSGGSSNYISSSWFGDPLSALGGQVTFTPDKQWFFKVGGYDTNPETMSRDQGLRLGTPGGRHGTLLVAEVEYKTTYAGGLDGDYRIGTTRSSANLEKVFNQAGFPAGTTDDAALVQDTDRAYFVNLEQQVTGTADTGGLRVFASLIKAEKNVRETGEVIAFGGFWKAPFASRPGDRVGLALGRNAVSDPLRQAQLRYNGNLPAGADPLAVQRYEYPIELNYNFAVARGVEIMPSIQHIRHPGGFDIGGATILGLQVSLDF